MDAFQLPVQSDPTVAYIEALTVNTITANYDLPLPNRKPNWFIRAVELIAVQNLAYELWFFSSATNMQGTMATDRLIGMVQFSAWTVGPPATKGWPVYNSGASPADQFYRAYVEGLNIPYRDQDAMSLANPSASTPLGQGVTNANIPNAKLHTRLVNRSATTKGATTAGAVQVTVYVAPMGQQPA